MTVKCTIVNPLLIKMDIKRCRQINIPDSSLKEVKLISIWTLTSPQPLTSSLKSSAVKSSKAFLGSTSSKPFLIAYERQPVWIHILINDKALICIHTRFGKIAVYTYMKRLLSNHQHSVLCVPPHIFVNIEGSYWHVDPSRQELNLNKAEWDISFT